MAKLGKELWKKIQTPQGRAFISDQVEDLPDEQVIEIASIALDWQVEGVKVLRAFLRKHLTKRALDSATPCPNCGSKKLGIHSIRCPRYRPPSQ